MTTFRIPESRREVSGQALREATKRLRALAHAEYVSASASCVSALDAWREKAERAMRDNLISRTADFADKCAYATARDTLKRRIEASREKTS